MEINILVIVISALIALAVLIYNPAKTYGVPAALIFIMAGLFIGNGDLIPAFNYPEQTEFISQFALSIIIFTGGLQTPYSKIKPVLGEGLVISNFGVLLTILLLGLFVSYVTPLTFMEGLLLGAIVSSTDAAATFNILETKKLKLKYNTDKVLEFESATNDPIAMIMTLMFCMILTNQGDGGVGYYTLYFLQQLIVGGGIAFVVAIIIKQLFSRIIFKEESLKPIFLLAMLLVTTLGAELFDGNILVASYVFGIMVGNAEFKFKKSTFSFFSTLSWLAQATMFVILGLQVFPALLFDTLMVAWLPTLFLFLFARPISIIISYLPFKQPFSKQAFVSWIGIKGATPIVFALVPLIMGVPNAELIFNITVVIVISSMIIHGFTLEIAAKKLSLLDD